jgi:hypothetical protein
LAAVLVMSAPAHALPSKLPPIEQCDGDPSFTDFRQKLTSAVVAADRDEFLQLLAPDVLADFGGGRGRDLFAEHIDNAGGELWMYYEQVVHLGCASIGDARVIPSLAVQFEPWADEDLTNVMVALPGVKLRKTWEEHSPEVATLNWDVVTIVPGGDVQTEVILADGRRGWLFDNEFTGASGYRFWMEKRDGQWMVTALVAGD